MGRSLEQIQRLASFSDMIPLLYILLTALAALTDSLFFQGNKAASKLVEDIFIIGLFITPLLYKKSFNWRYILDLGLIFLCIRIATFDLFYNLFTGLELTFQGTTTFVWDGLMAKLANWELWIARAFSLFVGGLIYFKKIKE